MSFNPKVDFYFSKSKPWSAEISLLRKILLSCELSEQLKWGCPCYTLDDANVVLVHVFKHYCALLFFKGALLKDPKSLLVQQTENVQSARQQRFTSVEEIAGGEAIIRAFIKDAIRVENAGLKVEARKPSELIYPEEFEQSIKQNPALKKAFNALTPGRQRAYNLYFSAPKQSKTRMARVEKCIDLILIGKGLNDE